MFWGFIFLLFDINASVYSIDILPDFIGWILAVYGFGKLLHYEKTLKKTFRFVKISGIFMITATLLQFILSFIISGNFIFTYILADIFWLLKLIALNILIFALFTVRERINDTQRFKTLEVVWLAIVMIEILTFLYNNFLVNHLPDTIQKAIMQVLVVGVIFFKVWFVFSIYKILKALNDSAK